MYHIYILLAYDFEFIIVICVLIHFFFYESVLYAIKLHLNVKGGDYGFLFRLKRRMTRHKNPNS